MILCITGSRDEIWYHDWFDLWNLSTGGFCCCTTDRSFSEYAGLERLGPPDYKSGALKTLGHGTSLINGYKHYRIILILLQG